MKDTRSFERIGGVKEQVLVRSSDGKTSEATLWILPWDRASARRSALTALAVCWGLALASLVFIPFMNLILVPAFVILGLIWAWRSYSETSVILGGEINCPSCGSINEFGESGVKLPVESLCQTCHRSLKVDRIPVTTEQKKAG